MDIHGLEFLVPVRVSDNHQLLKLLDPEQDELIIVSPGPPPEEDLESLRRQLRHGLDLPLDVRDA